MCNWLYLVLNTGVAPWAWQSTAATCRTGHRIYVPLAGF